MTLTSRVDRARPIPPRGLRRQWRGALVVIIAALVVVLGGATATYLAMSARYRTAAHNLDRAISQSAALDGLTQNHEGLSHELWQGTPIDRAVYLQQQAQITTRFAVALHDLRGPGEHPLVVQALAIWRVELISRDLWGPAAGSRAGVTAQMQQEYGGQANQVYNDFNTLSEVAIHDGTHDIVAADRFQRLGLALLFAVFAIMLLTLLYFARRLTNDVVRPMEVLQAATERLRDGSLDHQIDTAMALGSTEVGALAGAFNEMARALHESHHDLNHRASHDGLTGLPNRAAFRERLASHFQAGAADRAETISVLFRDVDDFKHVNDSLGHAAGDALLRSVAERLSACVRPYDFLARLGGDEFAAIVVDTIADTSAAPIIAQRVLDAFATPMRLGGSSVRVALSIGVCVARPDTDAERLLSEADFAMYTAKRGGKGRSKVYAPEAVHPA